MLIKKNSVGKIWIFCNFKFLSENRGFCWIMTLSAILFDHEEFHMAIFSREIKATTKICHYEEFEATCGSIISHNLPLLSTMLWEISRYGRKSAVNFHLLSFGENCVLA